MEPEPRDLGWKQEEAGVRAKEGRGRVAEEEAGRS